MEWIKVNFGKNIGMTLPQVMFKDPDWFFWACEKSVFKGGLEREAEEINRKARSIKVPQNGEEKMVVEYIIDKTTEKFGTMQIVPESRPYHKGSSTFFRSDVIDMSIPRQIYPGDKFGNQNFILALKIILFGNTSYKMTKRRCGEFFENGHNF